VGESVESVGMCTVQGGSDGERGRSDLKGGHVTLFPECA
jgi:hypothetical protein